MNSKVPKMSDEDFVAMEESVVREVYEVRKRKGKGYALEGSPQSYHARYNFSKGILIIEEDDEKGAFIDHDESEKVLNKFPRGKRQSYLRRLSEKQVGETEKYKMKRIMTI